MAYVSPDLEGDATETVRLDCDEVSVYPMEASLTTYLGDRRGRERSETLARGTSSELAEGLRAR